MVTVLGDGAATGTYTRNPDVFRDRRCSASASAWVRQFQCEDMRPLIICRGPVRKEAMDVFEQMGIRDYGILLSDKDTVVHTNAVAPELRGIRNRDRVHRVSDYTGADQAERDLRIAEIVAIAVDGGYDSVFAGYGFMAEDAPLVEAIEAAGLSFIGPGSATVRAAGRKDIAKRTALAESIDVTPGVDNVTALALVARCGDAAGLAAVAEEHGLTPPPDGDLALAADALLDEAVTRGIDVLSNDEILDAVRAQARGLLVRYPDRRLRLKAVGGGGGKGQRVLDAASQYEGAGPEARAEAAAADAAERAREIWSEVKAMEPGANKNVLLELNIDTNRHQEVQVLGNGDWCVALGLRDCSAQMHEQKLVEVSVTSESLEREIALRRERGDLAGAEALETDLRTLLAMEAEAARFGKAVSLDSVSTFECIVDGADHYFMEMNTRIQVEHRVTELCYALEFVNPDDGEDVLRVESLIEAMTLVARHGGKLPEPRRAVRYGDSVEIRLNATDAGLNPAAGGRIESWSNAVPGEIRDDQGISVHNPDTDLFMPYYLAGAYDSNIALLLTAGEGREETFAAMLDVLRRTRIKGRHLRTNLDFHYGLCHWLASQDVRAKIETRFVQAYLGAVARLFEHAQEVEVEGAFEHVKRRSVEGIEDPAVRAGYARAMDLKTSLLARPLQRLLERPHLLAGWAAMSARHCEGGPDGVRWLVNPIDVLLELYRYLDMDRPTGPAAEAIWDHDRELLDGAQALYARLRAGLSPAGFDELDGLLRAPQPPPGTPGALVEEWDDLRARHLGYQHGLQLLALPRQLAHDTGFDRLRVRPDLTVDVPPELYGSDALAAARKVLAPPPAASADEVVAELGGMFYPREAPGMPRFLDTGTHFEPGDTLYVIEVMKMFTKVTASFAGTVDECVMGDSEGVVVSQGELLFRVTPDERPAVVDPAEVRRRRVERTAEIAERCL
ncbi:MAG: biotin carboxylase [Gammaproteobacteria bacterium]|nr:biotin carboxylase [Gammaproteobacteria bacterium]